jgi:dTDP-4-amino-4,6-dideoxygalactose transaminase
VIPFFSFSNIERSIVTEWKESFTNQIELGQFIGGQTMRTFENEWAEYTDSSYCVGTGNGYDALVLSLRALEIGPGSIVVVPAHTFIATWLAVRAVGATIVGLDCDLNGQINLDELEKLSIEIDCLIVVHMHGVMTNMERVMRWASNNCVSVIEDCAQAHGAFQNGKHAGTFGTIGAFSFYPTKNLGAMGDAGCVISNSQLISETIRSLSNYGSLVSNKYEYAYSTGINSRLDPIQAAFLSVNLRKLTQHNHRRAEIAVAYLEVCRSIGIEVLGAELASVWHHFPILIKNRDIAREKLLQSGVGTEIHYPSIPPAVFKNEGVIHGSRYQNAEFISASTLSIPLHPWLRDSEVEEICKKLIVLSDHTFG